MPVTFGSVEVIPAVVSPVPELSAKPRAAEPAQPPDPRDLTLLLRQAAERLERVRAH